MRNRAQKPCSVAGCEKPTETKGLCKAHYLRMWRYGDPLAVRRPACLCSVPDCGNAHYGRGFCNAHYRRLRRYGDPLSGRTAEGEPEGFYRDVVLNYEGDDCLAWPFNRSTGGYGRVLVDGRKRMVHRLVCEVVNGAPPTPEHQAAHSCGKGHLGCVTKGHLSWKTAIENQADKLIHGTHNRGERHGQAKITEAQAKEIISLRGKESLRETGARFGISPKTVSNIQARRRWVCLADLSALSAINRRAE